jgi:hypothetical protein
VENGSGGSDTASAELTLFDGVALTLSPANQSGPTGQPLAYELTVTNLEADARSYDLTVDGLAAVTLPASVTVAGAGSETVTLTAIPPAHGPHPFTIHATTTSGATAGVDGVAVGEGRFGVLVEIAPGTLTTGPGATAVYTVTVTNVGDSADSYTLDLDIPTGWSAALTRLGQPVSQVDLPAQLFNSVALLLHLTPDENATPGNYPVTLTADSLDQPGVTGSATASAEVTTRGVGVVISPPVQLIDPAAQATWQVLVTNHGSVADTFELTTIGAPALAGQLAVETVSLAPGASQTVALTADDLRFLLSGSQQFAVLAQSATDSTIQAEDRAAFTIAPQEDVVVSWLPESQTVTATLEMGLMLLITNTGNLATAYAIAFDGLDLTAVAESGTVILPPGSTAALPVTVTAAQYGQYSLEALAASQAGTTDSDLILLTFLNPTAVTWRGQEVVVEGDIGRYTPALLVLLTALTGITLHWKRSACGTSARARRWAVKR